MAILKRQPLFPHVIELNHQARRRISCSVYLIYDDDNNWTLIDIGYEDAVDECLEIIRQLDFPFSKCVTLFASHADVDHIQGFAKAKQVLKTTVTSHPLAARPLETARRCRNGKLGWHGQVLLPVSAASGHGQTSTFAHATPGGPII